MKSSSYLKAKDVMNISKLLTLVFCVGTMFSISAMEFDKSPIKESAKIVDKSEKKDDELDNLFVKLRQLCKKKTKLQREFNRKYPKPKDTILCVYTGLDQMRDLEGAKIVEIESEIQGILTELGNS